MGLGLKVEQNSFPLPQQDNGLQRFHIECEMKLTDESACRPTPILMVDWSNNEPVTVSR